MVALVYMDMNNALKERFGAVDFGVLTDDERGLKKGFLYIVVSPCNA